MFKAVAQILVSFRILLLLYLQSFELLINLLLHTLCGMGAVCTFMVHRLLQLRQGVQELLTLLATGGGFPLCVSLQFSHHPCEVSLPQLPPRLGAAERLTLLTQRGHSCGQTPQLLPDKTPLEMEELRLLLVHGL